ncbi:MAG: hypothetical protein KDA71_22445 [Planctomycetales bacterium]|nr:hypothetical protein [Planctomycetales bacterium]
MPPRQVLVFGLGSPHGDDQAGWLVARQIAEQVVDEGLTNRVQVYELRSPWDLLDHLCPDAPIVIVDAFATPRSTAPSSDTPPTELPPAESSPAEVMLIEESALATSPLAARSSHGGSLPELLQLARSLAGQLGPITIIGIPARNCAPGSEVSNDMPDRIAYAKSLVWQQILRDG